MGIDKEYDNKPTPAEWGGIIGFVSTLFITLEANLSIFVGFFFFFVFSLFHTYIINKKHIKRMKKIGNFLIVVLVFCFLTDTLLTYHAVLITKIANEVNFGVLFLWGFFGVILGELIRFIIILLVLNAIHYQLNHKSYNRNKVAFILILFLLCAWVLVIANNIYQLLL